jgi:hypothetical protein
MSKESEFSKIHSPLTAEHIKDMLDVMKSHKPNNEPMFVGCRNCGDHFELTMHKKKCNCGNVDFSLFNGGEAEAKAEKGMKQLRSWKQNKKK